MKFAMIALLALGVATCQAGGVQSKSLADSVVPVLSQSRLLGPANGTQTLGLAISLQPRHLPELEAFANAVSDPASPDYHNFITPEQVGETYGASATDVNNVVNWLKSQGMKITLITPNRMSVLAECTVAQAERAFGTKINEYQGPDPLNKTITYRANATPLKVPANLGPVYNVMGVESYTRPIPRSTTLTPALVRGLYNTAPSYANNFRGQGRRIGFSNWDGWKLSNALQYISAYGLPVPGGGAGTNVHDVIITSGGAGISGGGEGDLDLQMQLAVAPLADIYVYDNYHNYNLVGVLSKEVTDNYDIISESWGWNISGSTQSGAHTQHLSMTAQGMTYMAASGDSGTNIEPYSYPDYEPEVLSVGGSVATVNTSTGARISEFGWSGGGGGWSNNSATFNILPSWQHGTGVRQDINHRLVPDMAGHSDATNGAYYVYYNGLLYAFSGTSCAAPNVCGCLATVEQRLAAGGYPARFGRIQDLIYTMNGRADVWYDITSGGNGSLPNGQASVCTAGWDTVTGWGAPNWDGFYNAVVPNSVTISPAGYVINHGTYAAGDVASLGGSDDNWLSIVNYAVTTLQANEIDVTISGTSSIMTPTKIVLSLEGHVNTAGITQKLYMHNFVTNAWDLVDTRAATQSDAIATYTVNSGAANYIGPAGLVEMRVGYKQTGAVTALGWKAFVDQVSWTVWP